MSNEAWKEEQGVWHLSPTKKRKKADTQNNKCPEQEKATKRYRCH